MITTKLPTVSASPSTTCGKPRVLLPKLTPVVEKQSSQAQTPKTLFIPSKLNPSTATAPVATRPELLNYPKVPEGTRTYSIFKFPDPKNLMKLPEYDCQYCSTSCYTTETLSRHAFRMHSKFVCSLCLAEHPSRNEMEEHKALVHNKPPALDAFFFEDFGNKFCTFCGGEFPSLKELKKHTYSGKCTILATKLKGEPWKLKGKSYSCDFCNKVFLCYLINFCLKLLVGSL
jgi:hypothetical protein